ncbi:MAG: hypothetical protein IT221_13835 [Fluviicola sp.]|nr:hypothetical protein [Fluviicola sp.]
MRILLSLAFVALLVTSCGTMAPYTDTLKEQYDLSPENLMKVQFFTSSNIILEKSSSSGNQTTGDDGTLVSNTNSTQERIIIPKNTACRFEKQGPNNEIIVRFEVGTGKILTFAQRPTQTNGKYYLVADWKQNGGTVVYGNENYNVQAGGSSAFLVVKQKNLARKKRKDRVVKGMKV